MVVWFLECVVYMRKKDPNIRFYLSFLVDYSNEEFDVAFRWGIGNFKPLHTIDANAKLVA